MSSDLSSNAKEALNAQETDEVFIVLLELSHPDFDETIYLSSDPTTTLLDGDYGTVSNGTDYLFFPFEISLPPQDETFLGKTVLRIDNVTRDIIREVIQIQGEPITVTVKIVLGSDPDSIEIEMPSLRMTNVSANATEMQADLYPRVIQDEQWPYDNFSRSDFPGLFSGF